MRRVRKGAARRQSRKRVLKAVRGYTGAPGRLYRLAKEINFRAQVNARIGRKQKKRNFRTLWIIRLSAACAQRGINYSLFINGCKKAGIGLDRKMLSEIAIADPAGFDAIVEQSKASL